MMRNLPPNLSEADFREIVKLPEHDYFKFCPGDPTSVSGSGVFTDPRMKTQFSNADLARIALAAPTLTCSSNAIC